MRRCITKAFLTVLFLTIISGRLYCAEEKYYPYPVIFVHGLNSNSGTWKTAMTALKDYFYVDSTSSEQKYFPLSNGEYLRVYDYGAQNNGDASYISHGLKTKVSEALSALPLPDGQKKVIIVAHSMGGIVTRSFLKQYPAYEDKIDKIVFIGTPHEGSPLASILILVKREIPNLEGMMRQQWAFEALDLIRVLLLERKSPKAYYHTLLAQMTVALLADNAVLTVTDKVIHIDLSKYNPKQCHNQGQGVAVGQLVVPEWIMATRTFNEGLAKLFPLTLPENLYQKYDTFLNLASNNLSIPAGDKVRTIYGTGGAQFIPRVLGAILLRNPIIPDISGFPAGNGIPDLFAGDGEPGDAIVTYKSQTAMGAGHGVYSWHCEEPNQWQAILKVIDEAPQIERVRAVALDDFKSVSEDNKEYYLVVKLKEYLLADIAVETMTLNGVNLLPSNYRGIDGYYKPYLEFHKDFLSSRDGPSVTDIDGNQTKINLEPGEFCIKKVTLKQGKNTLSLKIKNPAAEYASSYEEKDKFTDEMEVYISRPIIDDLLFANGCAGNWPVPPKDWNVDVPKYDQDEPWFPPIPHPDFTKDCGTLTKFTIRGSSAKEIRASFLLYPGAYTHNPGVLFIVGKHPKKKLVMNESLTLGGPNGEGNYSGTFTNSGLNAVWYGTDDNENKVPEFTWYKIQIRVEHEFVVDRSNKPAVASIVVPSINWYREDGCEDIVYADPTFIQHSKEAAADFFSKDTQDKLKMRLAEHRLRQRKVFEGFDYGLASRRKEYGVSDNPAVKLDGTLSYKNQELNPAALSYR